MKNIDINECHNILLKIATAFDSICRKHQIPYYMLGGTMLGAIRHKGFIPWDDDMDFGVERKYFPKLIKILSEELPVDFKIRTSHNSNNFFSNFIKIEDTRTEVFDCWHDNAIDIGICIDIFPLDNGRKSLFQTQLFVSYIFFLLQIKDYLYFNPKYRHGIKKYVAIILRKTNFIPIKNRLRYVENLINKYTEEKSAYLINYYGRYQKKEIVSKKIFGKPTNYEFEKIMLKGVENPDIFLSDLYGNNYMQLPPKEKQEKHSNIMRYK